MLRYVFAKVSLSPGYGTLSVGHVCECWKVTRSWCAAFALTTKGLSVAPTMGQSCSHTDTQSHCTQRHILFLTLSSHVSVYSKIKVWDLQAALDPRAPASTLCLRTLVVSVTYLSLLPHGFFHIRWSISLLKKCIFLEIFENQ